MTKLASILLVSLVIIFMTSHITAQVVMFDFDNAPLHTSLPIDLMVNGITASFSATSQGFSIQEANIMGFTPQGFAGYCIYPNSINISDLLISFDHTLTDFSIMYAVQELACDTSATMRVTAFINGNFVGSDTKVASVPGTWPVDTLRCSFQSGFDSVVIHFDSHPPACQDWGPVFMADNMRITPISSELISEVELPKMFFLSQNYPNPFNPTTKISYNIFEESFVTIKVFDVLGKEIVTLISEYKNSGKYEIEFNAVSQTSGIYYYRLQAGSYIKTKKMALLK